MKKENSDKDIYIFALGFFIGFATVFIVRVITMLV